MDTLALASPQVHYDDKGNLLLAVGPGAGMLFVEHYFTRAKEGIRLASAYFSLSGYELARPYIGQGVTLRILVGYSDGPHVQQAVLEEILADLGQCEINLAAAIAELVSRMEKNQFFIRDARAMTTAYHCKFYSSDTGLVWHGSTNFSRRGLLTSAEQASRAPDPIPEAIILNNWFDAVSEQGYDLLAELLERLKAWLLMATPFEIYLKILAVLRQLPEPERQPSAHLPTHYQQMLIARVLRQLTDYDGAMLVAATGLGKTVIGAEIAAHCRVRGSMRRCLLLAPTGVRKEWLKHLHTDRNLAVDFFSLDVVFQPSSGAVDHQVAQLEECLRTADRHTLLIIDEAHTYRNQWMKQEAGQKPSLVFERLLPLARQQQVQVLLLTATVYGTDAANLKSLLRLLPPRAGANRDQAWTVRKAAEFASLPVVTVLGIPHVLRLARDRGDVDSKNRVFVHFGDEPRYLPEVLHLYRHYYELPLSTRVQMAFDEGCFDQSGKMPQHWFSDSHDRIEKGLTDTAYNRALDAWLSSSAALRPCLVRNLATPGYRDPPEVPGTLSYRSFMKQKRFAREQRLKPLLADCTTCTYSDDAKFMYLASLVQHYSLASFTPTGKVLIFVRRLSTAVYIADCLSMQFGEALRVASTVGVTAAGEPELKTRRQRDKILREFAPLAHHLPVGGGPDYHVLICTDADGVGVNLQDADTLVHYDLPAAADVLYQRVGRLLRMTPNPERRINIYTLEPALAHPTDFLTIPSSVRKAIQTRVGRLQQRHDNARTVLTTGVRAEVEQAQETLEREDIKIEQYLERGGFDAIAEDGPAHAEITHASMLEQHRAEADALPDYLLSSRFYFKSQARIIILLRAADGHHLILYNLKTAKIEDPGEAEILQQLACAPNEARALVSTAVVEQSANQAAQAWCQARSLPTDQAVKICALYLDPARNEKAGARRLLADAITSKP